jgi:transposase
MEFGRRLHWEALRGGLGRAQAKLVVADGAPWIWNVAQDSWAGASEVLDFYHASQHLWDLGRACAARTRRPPRSGSNRAVTNCGTDKSNKCWPRSLG